MRTNVFKINFANAKFALHHTRSPCDLLAGNQEEEKGGEMGTVIVSIIAAVLFSVSGWLLYQDGRHWR